MRLHNFHLMRFHSASENTVWEYPFVICTERLCHCSSGRLAAGPALWPLTLPLQGAHWYSQKLLSMEEDDLKKENPTSRAGGPSTPTLSACPPKWWHAGPVKPNNPQAFINSLFFMYIWWVLSLSFKAAFTVMLVGESLLFWTYIWLICGIHVSNSLHTKGMN